LIATNKTPRKYYSTDNSEIYAIIIPELKTLAVSSNGQFYTKQLYGDNYNDISEGIKNNYKTSNQFDIQPGDEIQLFYRKKWYNDSTNFTEYEDKQFKNIKYIGNTIIDGENNIVIRNLKLRGDSTRNKGNDDVISVITGTRLWFGHLDISDGENGNLDIKRESNYITIIWCKFS